MKSLEQLARSFEVGLSEVSKVAKELSLVSPAQARDQKYTLNSHQCATIRQELVRKGFIEEPPIGDSKTEAKKEPKRKRPGNWSQTRGRWGMLVALNIN